FSRRGTVVPCPGLNFFNHQSKGNHMNDFIVPISIIVLLLITIVVLKIGKIRHVRIVSEGYTGLLYRHGLFVRRLNAGRHILWGRGWTMTSMDVRQAKFLVAGQDVLTADNVALK